MTSWVSEAPFPISEHRKGPIILFTFHLSWDILWDTYVGEHVRQQAQAVFIDTCAHCESAP